MRPESKSPAIAGLFTWDGVIALPFSWPIPAMAR
jgi:hypothetical protein